MMADEDFKKEVFDWATEIKVKPTEVHLREMHRKWGSCSSRGRLTFSNELVNKAYEFRSKVIVHELLHLRYPIHGKMFHALLALYLKKKGIEAENIVIE